MAQFLNLTVKITHFQDEFYRFRDIAHICRTCCFLKLPNPSSFWSSAGAFNVQYMDNDGAIAAREIHYSDESPYPTQANRQTWLADTLLKTAFLIHTARPHTYSTSTHTDTSHTHTQGDTNRGVAGSNSPIKARLIFRALGGFCSVNKGLC